MMGRLSLCVIGWLLFSGCAPTAPSRAHVHVIGDSISIGYGPTLERELADVAVVTRIAENARNSSYTRLNLGVFAAPADVYIWNNGIWNTVLDVRPDTYTSLEQYEQDLRAIAAHLTQHGAKVYFILTTRLPVEVAAFVEVGREVALNRVAERVLPAYGITLVDLYSVPAELARNDLHFTAAGSKLQGEVIARVVRQGLLERNR